MRAARRPRFGAGRLGHAAGPPARALDRPRDDVLDPAEDGAAPAGRLVGAKAVVRVDVVPAPGARLAVQQIDVEKVVQSRRASRGCRARPGSAAAGSKGFAKTDRAAQRLVMIGSMGKAKAETPETKPVERIKQLDDVADHERQEDNGKLDSTIDKAHDALEDLKDKAPDAVEDVTFI